MARSDEVLVAIVGPTAAGKSALALRLAERLGAEIVSADSMQVYRRMDIGTAKPTPLERERVPHHGLDLVDPSELFSVADYRRIARDAIARVRARGRLPLLVGGTGLYVRAVVDGLGLSAPGPDWALRRRLEQLADRYGNEYLHRRLAAVDPVTAARLHPNDRRRVIRALEVYELSGRPLSYFHARDRERREQEGERALLFGITRPRDSLYRRIEERVDEQIRQGLLSEVRALLHRGFGENIVSLQALGYKEFLPYLAGQEPLADGVHRLKRNTRQLARRQLIWFRADRRIQWLDLDRMSMDGAMDHIAQRIRQAVHE